MGVGIYLLLRTKAFGELLGFEFTLVLTIQIITLLGIWAASRTERIMGRKDPGKVVVDEVAGQLISLIPTLMPILSTPIWIMECYLLRPLHIERFQFTLQAPNRQVSAAS